MSEFVIYHKACNDGFCAAWVARKIFPNAVFHAASHGSLPPNVEGRDVYILDFSYKRPITLGMKEKAKSVTIIDHHKTAVDELVGIDGCVFDMSKSGARLAWEYFKPKQSPPWLVLYTEDRDLNKWILPHSKEVNAAVSSYPMDFAVWDTLDRLISIEDIRSSSNEFVQEGAAICRFEERQMERIVSNAREVMLDDHRILAANTSVNFNDVAGKLARNRFFGVAWYRRDDGKFVYSLRSEEHGADVSEIAKKHGGGGHRHSAGFEDPELIIQEIPRGA